MRSPEQVFNLLMGLSAVSWCVLGLTYGSEVARFTPVRLAISTLHLAVGALFVFRAPLLRSATPAALAASIPSLMVSGFAFKLAPPLDRWPWYAEALFVAAACLALVSLVSLGRSFAILPALRSIVVRGPFRFVRHPAYASELTMVLACWLAGPSLGTSWPLFASAPLVVLRILAEERLLSTDSSYQDYASRVSWRLIPGIW